MSLTEEELEEKAKLLHYSAACILGSTVRGALWETVSEAERQRWRDIVTETVEHWKDRL
jgi:hypothetical protein